MKITNVLFSKVIMGITVFLILAFTLNILTGCSPVGELKNSSIEESMQDNMPAMNLIPVAVEDIDDTGYLVLVNLDYPLIVEFNDSEFSQVFASVPTLPVGMQDMYLHPTALMAVEEMFNSARVDDIGPLSVTSAFRDYEHQQELYDILSDEGNFSYVQPPGYSEHHTGLAVDIGSAGVSGSTFGSSPQGRWLADNSYRFGFILRYPEGAEPITGINYEPWHFRYVGKVHSQYIYENNLVFEEYIELIQEQGTLYFQIEGIDYYVLYQVPQNGTIYVPEGMDFIISRDNTGGYIVTAW